MICKNLLLLCCAMILGSSFVQAQDSTSVKVDTAGIAMKTSVKKIDLKPKSNVGKLAIGGSFGTTPGIDLSFQFANHFAVRASWVTFSYSQKDLEFKSGNETLKGNVDLNMGAYSFALDFYPSVKSSFKIFAGVSSIQKASISLNAAPTQGYTVGAMSFTPDKIGTLNFSVDYGKTTVPFAGLGFGRAVPKRRVGFGFEGGLYYLNSPNVMLGGTKFLASMSEQQPKVQTNMNDWRYYPVFNFRLAVKLN